MTNLQEGQVVRIKQTAFGDSTEPADVETRGQTAELLQCMGTENGEELWRAFVDATGDEVYFLGSEIDPQP